MSEELDVRIATAIDGDLLALAIAQGITAALEQPDVLDRLTAAVAERLPKAEG